MRQPFPKFSMQFKMFVILGFGLLGFTVYFGFNYYTLNTNGRILESAVQKQLPVMEYTENIGNRLAVLRDGANQATISQNFDSLAQMDAGHKAILEFFDGWSKGQLPKSSEAAILKEKYVKAYGRLNSMIQDIVSGISNLAAVKESFKTEVMRLGEVEIALQEIKKQIKMDLETDIAASEKMGQRARLVGLLILVCALFSVALFYWILLDITRSLNAANSSLQSTAQRLLGMVEEAQVSATHLRETAYRQTSSSTKTSSSMEEMKRLLLQTSRTSSNAVHHSQASFKEAADGIELVQSLTEAMAEIDQSNTELEEVTQVVKQIRDRTNVINEIVFKTQMLSFNANIEAARAGQHGLGFAVVATEMGSLAEMSGKAAQQINELLDRSARKVDSTVTRTKDKIEKGNQLSGRAYQFFKQLTDRAGQLKEFVSSISAAAAEQNAGVTNVAQAMTTLNQTAAESDRMAQRISTLADGLKEEAMGLAQAVGQLNQLVHGENRIDPPAEPPANPPFTLVADEGGAPMKESA